MVFNYRRRIRNKVDFTPVFSKHRTGMASILFLVLVATFVILIIITRERTKVSLNEHCRKFKKSRDSQLLGDLIIIILTLEKLV